MQKKKITMCALFILSESSIDFFLHIIEHNNINYTHSYSIYDCLFSIRRHHNYRRRRHETFFSLCVPTIKCTTATQMITSHSNISEHYHHANITIESINRVIKTTSRKYIQTCMHFKSGLICF